MQLIPFWAFIFYNDLFIKVSPKSERFINKRNIIIKGQFIQAK